METYEDFKNKVLKLDQHRKFKINHSFGVYDVYKALRKEKWQDVGRPLKEHEFYSIIREMNNLLAEEIERGYTVVFPSRMGQLELRKVPQNVIIKDGHLKIPYPIDWDKTLKLWYTDEEARKKKQFIYMEAPYVYKVKYSKRKADYENQSFYQFELNRNIKKSLKEHIKQGLDTLYEGY